MEITGWKRLKIKDFCKVIRGASPRPKGDKRFYGGSVPRLMVEDVTRDGKYVTPIVDSLTELGATMSRPMKAGSLTVVCSGTVGVPAFLAVDACIHDGFLGLISLKENISKEFVFYQLEALKKQIDEAATHGGIFTNLTVDGFSNFEIDLPISLREQQAIAEVLSNVDSLIVSLEKLIEKKQSVFDSLLSSLIEIDDNTDSKSISLNSGFQIKARIGWQGLTSKEYLEHGKYLLVTGTEFLDGNINWEDCWRIEKERFDQDKNIQLKDNDVLITKDGTIGKVAQVCGLKMPATLNSGVFVIRPITTEVLSRYLFYVFRSNLFKSFLNELSAGSTINHLYQKDIVKFKFPIPNSITRQEYIVRVLDEVRSETNFLSQKLDKAKKIKVGIMQELLKGRIRLI